MRVAETATGCHEWQGARNGFGYGLFWLDGKYVRAHRIAYELASGPIPAGLVVRHQCDNPPCVNPAHLELGTQADNIRDSFERNRRDLWQWHVTQCPSGHEYTDANTRIYRGKRHCRACDRERQAARRAA